MNLVEAFTNEQLKKELPVIRIGDTIRVHNKIKEGNRERIQMFEGTVIAKHGGGISETFTVRRVSYGCGIEKTFPIHSPNVEKVDIIRSVFEKLSARAPLQGHLGATKQRHCQNNEKLQWVGHFHSPFTESLENKNQSLLGMVFIC